MRALAFSGGKDSMACLHLLRDALDLAIYVDTGFSYPETLAMVEYAGTIVRVHVVHSDRKAQNERDGIPADVVPIDWTRFGHETAGKKALTIQGYPGCCYANIALPLLECARTLGVKELVYGERFEESHKSTSVDGNVVMGIKRLHPIESWTEKQVLDYLATKMQVPAHYAIKHSSLDCYDCTAFRRESSDRIQWTREHYPEFHAAYAERAAALDGALREALYG